MSVVFSMFYIFPVLTKIDIQLQNVIKFMNTNPTKPHLVGFVLLRPDRTTDIQKVIMKLSVVFRNTCMKYLFSGNQKLIFIFNKPFLEYGTF